MTPDPFAPYQGRHRDNSAEAESRSRYLDHEARWNRLFPCNHYHARHSAFVVKGRAE